MGQSNLIIQTAFVGDLLLSIPLIKALRALDPDTPLTLLCRQPLGEFFLKTKLVDHVVEVDKASGAKWSACCRELRGQKFKWIVSPHESIRTAMLVRSLRAEKKISFRQWWNGWIYNERVSRPMALPEALRQLALVVPHVPQMQEEFRLFVENWKKVQPGLGPELGLPNVIGKIPDWAAMTLSAEHFPYSSEKLEALITRHGLSNKPLIAIAPGSVWATKMWTTDGFIQVGNHFASRGYQVVVVGTSAESSACQEVVAKVSGAVDLAGQTSLYELALLFRQSRILFCNDSGAMHVASVTGLKTVAMFGPTVLSQGYRPWQTRALAMQIPLPCRPCGKHGATRCPIGTHACMKELKSRDVITKGMGLLSGK